MGSHTRHGSMFAGLKFTGERDVFRCGEQCGAFSFAQGVSREAHRGTQYQRHYSNIHDKLNPNIYVYLQSTTLPDTSACSNQATT